MSMDDATLGSLRAAAISAIKDAQDGWSGWDFAQGFVLGDFDCVAECVDDVREAIEKYLCDPQRRFEESYWDRVDADRRKELGYEDEDEDEDEDDDDDDALPEWAERLIKTAEDFEEEITGDAEGASDYGDEAIAAIEDGDPKAAMKAIRSAARIEAQYGDDYRYGPAEDAVKLWARAQGRRR